MPVLKYLRFLPSTLLLSMSLTAEPVEEPATPVYRLDLWELFESEDLQTLNEQANATYFITALQGIVNRDEPILFLDAQLNLMGIELEGEIYGEKRDTSKDLLSTDARWLEWIQSKGLLGERDIVDIEKFSQLIDIFGDDVSGLVLWDMETPASVNLALTAAGAEELLPVSRDFDEGKLMGLIESSETSLEVKRDFTGFRSQAEKANITGKELVYNKMMELYLVPQKSSPSHLWFNLDAFAFIPPVESYGGNLHLGNRNILQHNGLYNGDYWIAQRGIFVDLYSLDHEAPNDDPEQTPGTDLRIWNDILEETYKQRDGAFGVMGGFAPWWVKYSDKVGNSMDPIHAEQSFIRLATSYNLWNDADAAFGLANGSFYQHLPLAPADQFVNPEVPERELEKDTVYVCFIMLDYDGAAWLNQAAHSVFDQPGRGILPLNWAINPLLADRVPHAFNYLLENRSDQDFFRIADNGAGYIDPYYLVGSNRTGRVKEDGFEQYNEAAKPYLDRLNMDLMGFYISDQEFAVEFLEPIAELTPAGMGLNRTPTIKSAGGVTTDYVPHYHHTHMVQFKAEMERVFQRASSDLVQPEFYSYRLILVRPHIITDMVAELQAKYPDAKIEFLDMHSYMDLKAQKDALPLASKFMNETSISASADDLVTPIEARQVGDGAYEVIGDTWRVGSDDQMNRFLYFSVDRAFAKVNELNNDLKIKISLRADTPISVGLHYNSMWPNGNFPQPYAEHEPQFQVTPKEGIKTVEFSLDRPFFMGSQNGSSDFRFRFHGKGRIDVYSVQIETE